MPKIKNVDITTFVKKALPVVNKWIMIYSHFMKKTNPKIDFSAYFLTSSNPLHKQYQALRKHFVDGLTAEQVALEPG